MTKFAKIGKKNYEKLERGETMTPETEKELMEILKAILEELKTANGNLGLLLSK